MNRQLSVAAASAVAVTVVGLFVAAPHAMAVASAFDPASAVRGSLGVSLDDLDVKNTIGELTLYVNGALAVLFGIFAAIAARANARMRNAAKRPSPVPGSRVRATMGDAWMRLSRRMAGSHGTATRH
jgi:hypothetical protein